MNKFLRKFLFLLSVLVTSFFVYHLMIQSSSENASEIIADVETNLSEHSNDLNDFNVGNLIKLDNPQVFTKKKLAVIVPIRNCLRNLLKFVPHMSRFLNAQQIPHHIFMVHQEDLLRFNRATLINIGYLYTKDKFDYTVQHDIDLLPLNPKLFYEFPSNDSVFHVMNSRFHPHKRYRNIVNCIN